MLRLTESLYCDYAEVEKVDYYEKVLFNHILANYDPDQGMCVYYTSMKPGHYKFMELNMILFGVVPGRGLSKQQSLGK